MPSYSRPENTKSLNCPSQPRQRGLPPVHQHVMYIKPTIQELKPYIFSKQQNRSRRIQNLLNDYFPRAPCMTRSDVGRPVLHTSTTIDRLQVWVDTTTAHRPQPWYGSHGHYLAWPYVKAALCHQDCDMQSRQLFKQETKWFPESPCNVTKTTTARCNAFHAFITDRRFVINVRQTCLVLHSNQRLLSWCCWTCLFG